MLIRTFNTISLTDIFGNIVRFLKNELSLNIIKYLKENIFVPKFYSAEEKYET